MDSENIGRAKPAALRAAPLEAWATSWSAAAVDVEQDELPRVADQDELHVRAYHASIEPASLLHPGGLRPLTPRELICLILFPPQLSPEYVHALARRYLSMDAR